MASFFSRKIRRTLQLLWREDEGVTCVLTGSILLNYPVAAFLIYPQFTCVTFYACSVVALKPLEHD